MLPPCSARAVEIVATIAGLSRHENFDWCGAFPDNVGNLLHRFLGPGISNRAKRINVSASTKRSRISPLGRKCTATELIVWFGEWRGLRTAAFLMIRRCNCNTSKMD